jgi:hypothetical protein
VFNRLRSRMASADVGFRPRCLRVETTGGGAPPSVRLLGVRNGMRLSVLGV